MLVKEKNAAVYQLIAAKMVTVNCCKDGHRQLLQRWSPSSRIQLWRYLSRGVSNCFPFLSMTRYDFKYLNYYRRYDYIRYILFKLSQHIKYLMYYIRYLIYNIHHWGSWETVKSQPEGSLFKWETKHCQIYCLQ